LILIASLAAGEDQPIPVREYKKDDAALIELSKDGKLILTKGSRPTVCQGKKRKCRVEVLKWSWFSGHKKGLFLDRGRH